MSGAKAIPEVDGKRNTVRPWVPVNCQIRFVRSRLVTRLHKEIPFSSSSRLRCPRPLFRPEDPPPFDDALTERGCRPRRRKAGARWLLIPVTSLAARRTARRNCLFILLRVAREQAQQNGGKERRPPQEHGVGVGEPGRRACHGRWSGCSTKYRTSRHRWR